MAFKGDLEALILGVLQDGALHGYEIAKRIKRLSADSLSVGEGRLYPALHTLETEGRIEARWVEQVGKPARKVYALTPAGRTELEAQTAEWRKFKAGVAAILEGPRQAKEGGHV
jgi:transcriptional regulator